MDSTDKPTPPPPTICDLAKMRDIVTALTYLSTESRSTGCPEFHTIIRSSETLCTAIYHRLIHQIPANEPDS